MAATTTAILMAGAVGLSAYGKMQEGKEMKKAADFNAAMYQQEAESIGVSKELTRQQYERLQKKYASSTVTAVASSGFDLKGSALEVMNDTLTQVALDKQTELYNLENQRKRALAAAGEYTRQGKAAKKSATIGAVSTLLTGGNSFYQQFG